MDLLENVSNLNVLVFGDVMLDRYWWGNVERISPEAPVPVVRLNKTSMIAGGAANVAANVAGLGAKAYLVGVVGDDEEAKLVPDVLSRANVSADHLVKIVQRQTTVKTRVVAQSQQIVRLDQETNSALNTQDEDLVWQRIEKIIDQIHIIIVSDYAKGVLTDSLLSKLNALAQTKGLRLLVDPKGKNYKKYSGAFLITPNKKEAAEACKLEENGKNLIEDAGNQLMAEVKTESIIITQGEEGITLFEKGKQPLRLKAVARDVYDVTGAGDTFIATLAVALGCGKSLPDAAELANIAAGVVVEQIGTTTIKSDELKLAFAERKSAVN